MRRAGLKHGAVRDYVGRLPRARMISRMVAAISLRVEPGRAATCTVRQPGTNFTFLECKCSGNNFYRNY